MAEIRNYTMNFASGRPARRALTCPKGRLACAEMHLRFWSAESSRVVTE
jgi:hypothetical protein